LTRLEATRHRVTRSASVARATAQPFLKIVAPWKGCAGVEQKGRETWVTPGQWSIYDTTDSYAVANPEKVEHLIVMLPKPMLAERGLQLDALMARRLGGSGGISTLALQTMRNAFAELPSMPEAAARGVGEAITQLVHLSLLDLAGQATAQTQREALRERIKQHVAQHLADPAVRAEARVYLPWLVAAPLIGIASWMLDGIFIGATRTGEMRRAMLWSVGVYAVALWVLLPAFGNHGLWAALMVLNTTRAVTLAMRFGAVTRAAA